jgi:acyl-CoA hydrolase
MLAPPGCLTETELSRANGGIPESWGLIPRTMMNYLGDQSIIAQSATAIEVYGDGIFDLLDTRKMLHLSKSSGISFF